MFGRTDLDHRKASEILRRMSVIRVEGWEKKVELFRRSRPDLRNDRRNMLMIEDSGVFYENGFAPGILSKPTHRLHFANRMC